MKHTTNRAAVILIAVALLFCAVIPAGCKAKEADDAAVIEELSRQFIENFGTGDTEQLEGIVEDGFEYDFIGQENTDILLKIASRSEIVEFKGVSFDREDNTARARLKVSYIYVSGFVADQEGYMTYEDYLEAVDTYEDRRTMSLTINFRYDEDEGQWLIKKTSAENYLRRFDYYFVLDIVKVSPSEAEDMILNMYEDMAEGGFDQLSDVTPLVQEAFVAKLLNNEYDTDPAVTEAAPDFSAAYYKYIVDSGITITASDEDPYTFTVTGYAPAKESILEYFSSDEFLIELYMADIRSYFGLQDHDEIWSSFFAGVYYDLAKKLPGMPSEEYSAELYVDPYAYNNNYVWTYEDCLIPVDSEDVYWAGAFSDLDAMPYIEQAAEALLLAGEITEDQYDEYLDYAQEQEEVSGEQTTGYYGGEAVTVDWDGTDFYPNQAVNVIEEVPDWCTDGQLIYGTSEPDDEGIFMHYSKEPGWLNTAGYNITSDELTVMLLYDKYFTDGTVLEYDWYIDGETIEDTQEKIVEYSGQDEFEFTIPTSQIPMGSCVEFRLWEEGHSHVIAYVKLTQT